MRSRVEVSAPNEKSIADLDSAQGARCPERPGSERAPICGSPPTVLIRSPGSLGKWSGRRSALAWSRGRSVRWFVSNVVLVLALCRLGIQLRTVVSWTPAPANRCRPLHRFERQFRLTWDEHVFTNVTGRDVAMRDRRRQIASALLFRGAVSRDQIPDLSPALARTYAKTTARTLARDLDELVAIGLLQHSAEGYQANSTMLIALLPTRVSDSSEPMTRVVDRLSQTAQLSRPSSTR